MAVHLAKSTVDIGIVTTDRDASCAFYGEVLGLPSLDPVRMDRFSISRFAVGDCVLKILEFDTPPPAKAPDGGIGDASGIRYLTISVANLDEVLAGCRAANRPVIDGPTEIRPGVSIAFVQDPDGNIVEFVNRPAA